MSTYLVDIHCTRPVCMYIYIYINEWYGMVLLYMGTTGLQKSTIPYMQKL